MALIKCPECGKEVSDKAPACIHCGCPLEQKIYEVVNGVTYDISFLKDPDIKFIDKIKLVRESLNCDLLKAKEIAVKYCPKEQREREIQIFNTPKCPKCGSTAITTGARGANWAWGFIGASQTVNRCGNCGYTWKPKK